MPEPIVAISVDCLCAAQGKCYGIEIVEAAEQHTIPLTWLIGITEHDPMLNLRLYHNEYFHRIPAWHEIGLHLTFDTGAGNTVSRGVLIRVGKDLLKQFSIKPTAFRAANGDIEAGDITALEDIGILVDATPGSSANRPLNAPKSPYHPSRANIHQPGEARLWIAPVANINGARGYLDDGLDRLRPVIDAHLELSHRLVLGLTDNAANGDNLRDTISYLKQKNARFVTLTQLVTEI